MEGSRVESEHAGTRRNLLRGGAAAGLALTVGTHAVFGESEEEIPASLAADLMREHGVLSRLLLVYEEFVRRLQGGTPKPRAELKTGASIVRSFIEDYHEKLEEQYLFPRFERASKLVDLVNVLRAQHAAGRKLTDQVLSAVAPSSQRGTAAERQLLDSLCLFIRMYRPHAAREDTVLFPALRTIVTPKEYAELGERFEDKEHELFGKDGFHVMVDRVTTLEKALGLYHLSQFTPA
jgi:hemerythrin-like domain-containing protein